MDVAPIGLCSAVLKPRVWILAVAILYFLEPEVEKSGVTFQNRKIAAWTLFLKIAAVSQELSKEEKKKKGILGNVVQA